MLRYFIISFLLVLHVCFLCGQASSPSVEVRAVWLTTNWGLDWPSQSRKTEDQKKELCSILDRLAQANFNTVFFQSRLRGDVFYRSEIEPMSPFFKEGYTSFDPLAFVIEECHKRGLECHAWFVTFPLGTEKHVKNHKRQSAVYKYPRICKLHRGEWYLDPGNPNTQKYILSLVDEVVTKYDIDGIHFDYIRYPDNAKTFPDADTYSMYGKGTSLEDWRRENINILVRNIYSLVKERKNWVQVSSSPLGRYRPISSNLNDGWTAYGHVFQDAAKWLQEGVHDAIYPMMYYKENLFYPYLKDWVSQSNNRLVVPGLGAYMLLPTERDWAVEEITNQIDFIRDNDVKGQSFYRTQNVLDNTKGLFDVIKQDYYKYPAKLPPLTWLDNISPLPPADLEVFKTPQGLTCIRWQSANRYEMESYTVYTSFSDEIDVSNPQLIVATGLRQNEIYLNVPDEYETGIYYTVTASDRYHNESQPAPAAFFLHSSLIK